MSWDEIVTIPSPCFQSLGLWDRYTVSYVYKPPHNGQLKRIHSEPRSHIRYDGHVAETRWLRSGRNVCSIVLYILYEGETLKIALMDKNVLHKLTGWSIISSKSIVLHQQRWISSSICLGNAETQCDECCHQFHRSQTVVGYLCHNSHTRRELDSKKFDWEMCPQVKCAMVFVNFY